MAGSTYPCIDAVLSETENLRKAVKSHIMMFDSCIGPLIAEVRKESVEKTNALNANKQVHLMEGTICQFIEETNRTLRQAVVGLQPAVVNRQEAPFRPDLIYREQRIGRTSFTIQY